MALAQTMAVDNLHINGNRLRGDFETLAQIGATPEGGVNRLALSPDDMKARAWLGNQIERAGLLVRDDDAGNLSGVLFSDDPNARTLVIGSHLDTVVNGGRYDGAVGVLAALEVLRTVRESGVKLPVHLEVINFTDEEGCWQSLFGSQSFAGVLNPGAIRNHGDNVPFLAALTRAGINPRDVYRARRDPSTLAGFIELHIEQGERLQRAGVKVGVVTAIVGRATYSLRFFGKAAHAGTTLANRRQDALQGAAAYITMAHRYIEENYDHGVFNCGNLTVSPGKFNIVPSETCLTMECRHTDDATLYEMERALNELAEACAETYALSFEIKRMVRFSPAIMSYPVVTAIESACDKLDMSHMRLVSYSGHDAQILSGVTPSGMIFIPSVGGVSHNPQEYTEWQDVVNGANVLLHTVLDIALRN